jgi:hypothetical protein
MLTQHCLLDGRAYGTTKYPLTKMIRFAIDAITGFSVRPLRMASYFGIGFGVVSILLLGYVMINYLIGFSIDGWTSLAAIILALGSVQLLVGGVMGKYLSRLYIEFKGRPLFVIQEIVVSPDLSRSHLPSSQPNDKVQSD